MSVHLQLRVWMAAHTTPQQVALRCRIILLKADGMNDRRVAEILRINRHTCRLEEQDPGSGLHATWLADEERALRHMDSHDYVRNGTTTLFAALEVATGKVTGECYSRHNYGTHKHAKVRAWLEKHPRFHIHFIPTSSSWLNLVERWFAELTNKAQTS